MAGGPASVRGSSALRNSGTVGTTDDYWRTAKDFAARSGMADLGVGRGAASIIARVTARFCVRFEIGATR